MTGRAPCVTSTGRHVNLLCHTQDVCYSFRYARLIISRATTYLQVALVRSPLSRALSAYRSKFACGSGDLKDHVGPVSKLLALLAPNSPSSATDPSAAAASKVGRVSSRRSSSTTSSKSSPDPGISRGTFSTSGAGTAAISSRVGPRDPFSRARGRGCFDGLLEWAHAVAIAHANRERFRYGLYEVRAQMSTLSRLSRLRGSAGVGFH